MKTKFKNVTYIDLLKITKNTDSYTIIADNIAILEKAHEYSDHHKEALAASKVYGCFHCISIIGMYTSIKEWIDEGTTALCPRCGIDAILPYKPKEYPLTHHFLAAMHDFWFERTSKI